jgi:zinc transporter ZupT
VSLVAGCALAVLVVGWLIVSFSSPSPRREVLEWVSAGALYLLLAALFIELIQRAREQDNDFALVAFGFLGVLFGMGLLVTLYRAVATMRGGDGSGSSATN